MGFIRRISALAAPIPQLIPPWQRVPNACPEHPNCAMRLVRGQGREVWACSHPIHVMRLSPAIQIGVIPARVRAKSLPDNWRVIPEPMYLLPPPPPRQATGAMQPVLPSPAPVERETPCTNRPDWLQEVIAWAHGCVGHPSLQDITPEDCEPDLSDDEDDDLNPTVVEDKSLYQLRILARKKKE